MPPKLDASGDGFLQLAIPALIIYYWTCKFISEYKFSIYAAFFDMGRNFALESHP